MKDPQQLIDDYLHNTLEESGQAELRSWLMEDDAHMRHFTEALMFDEEIRAAVQAKEGANSAGRFTGSVTSIPQHPPSASPFRSTPKTAHRLARAAAWLGAFTWFGNKAQAAGAVSTTTTLLMTKTTTTTTTITAAILLAGGGSIYLIHQSNQQATARVELLQARKDAAHEATAGMRTSRPVAASPEAASRKTSAAVLTTKTNTEILQQINRLTGTNPNSGMITEAEALKTKLEALDGQKLKELLVEAEQMNDLHPEVMAYLLYLLSELSSADAVLGELSF